MERLLRLTLAERRTLERVRSDPSHEGRQTKANAFLYLDDGLPLSDVAQLLGVSERTLLRWVERFTSHRLAALSATTRRSGLGSVEDK
jgi:transposase-like protein